VRRRSPNVLIIRDALPEQARQPEFILQPVHFERARLVSEQAFEQPEDGPFAAARRADEQEDLLKVGAPRKQVAKDLM
jgi:hypothetical protein